MTQEFAEGLNAWQISRQGIECGFHLCSDIQNKVALLLVVFISHIDGALLLAGQQNKAQQYYGANNQCTCQNGD